MKSIVIVICILMAIIFLFPSESGINDGGTVHYDAILYDVYDVHRLNVCSPNDDGTYEVEYIDGIIIKAFGIEIYNNTQPYTTLD